jgi:hypothetical protein
MITAWCFTKKQEISDQFWEYSKYNLLNFSPAQTQYVVLQLKKKINQKIEKKKLLETSAKSRNLFFEFKDFQLVFAISSSQLIFLNVISFQWQFFFFSCQTAYLVKKTFKKICPRFLKLFDFLVLCYRE